MCLFFILLYKLYIFLSVFIHVHLIVLVPQFKLISVYYLGNVSNFCLVFQIIFRHTFDSVNRNVLIVLLLENNNNLDFISKSVILC